MSLPITAKSVAAISDHREDTRLVSTSVTVVATGERFGGKQTDDCDHGNNRVLGSIPTGGYRSSHCRDKHAAVDAFCGAKGFELCT